MCYNFIKVKAVNPNAPTRAYVPCGDCEDCFRNSRDAWSYRLMAEFDELRKRGWKIGFATLTYRQSCLPVIPKCCFRDELQYERIPCFSVQDARNFIKDIRRKLHKDFRAKSVRYMICGEYGSKTHRPHLHMIFSWNPKYEYVDEDGVVSVKEIPAEYIHKLVKKYWKYGWVIPYNCDGGYDKKGRYHRPFEVKDNGFFAAKYAAKYCCKDVEFFRFVDVKKFFSRSKVFKNCKPFHIQSRSLGLLSIKNLDVESKIDLLVKGRSFVGIDKRYSCPVYIRNKLLFDINYVVDLHTKKRLVRRDANEFFLQNYQIVYDKKVKFYEELFKEATTTQFWCSRGVNSFDSVVYAKSFARDLAGSGLSFNDLAQDYISLYGLEYEKSYNIDRATLWLSRYSQIIFPQDFGQKIDLEYWLYIQMLFGRLFENLAKCLPLSNSDYYDKQEIKHKLMIKD